MNYTPTHIISELIRSKAYDGVVFKSAVTDSYNLVLFDGRSVEFVDSSLRMKVKVDYSFQQVDNQFTGC